jgi:probable HAF family extracellular repeat protein
MKRRRLLIALSCLIALGLALVLLDREPPLYKVTVLPSLGGNFTLPCAINARGQVAGFSEVAPREYHLFLWDRKEGMRDLGPVRNDRIDLNDAGQIAATMGDPNGPERAFVWGRDTGRTILPTLGGDTSRALAINNLGQVVGEADTAAGVRHAFIWDSVSGIRDLTPSSITATRAWAVNDAGQVVIFGKGGPILVNADEGSNATPHPISAQGLLEINRAGDVAGVSAAGPRRWDVVLWREDSGDKVVFQIEAGQVDSPVLNDAGQMALSWTDGVGFELLDRPLFSRSQESCFWDPKRGKIPLDRYVLPLGGQTFWITDLDNEGRILGAAQSSEDNRSVGVLLEPIPERWDRRP